MVKMFVGSYINPFSNQSGQLINFATGAVATPEIQNSMVSYIEKAEHTVQAFVVERLGHPPDAHGKKSFYAPLP